MKKILQIQGASFKVLGYIGQAVEKCYFSLIMSSEKFNSQVTKFNSDKFGEIF